jgi:SAM-dependent methyltransferase
VLRALAAVGILHEDRSGAFALTALGMGLRANVRGSRHAWATFVGRPAVWASWGDLLHTVRTGDNAFRHVHGMDTWQFRAASPEESAVFDAAMRENSLWLADSLLAHYDFSRFDRIVDVGGGDGALLGRILAACPDATGKLLDLPHVAARARDAFAACGVANRAAVVPGSFFEGVPPEGDLYILKHVIHDWEDAQAARILRNCRRAMRPGARLILIERLVGHPNEDAETAFSDLNMLVNAGGRERTREEFAALLADSGLELAAIAALPTSRFILEAIPQEEAADAGTRHEGYQVQRPQHRETTFVG